MGQEMPAIYYDKGYQTFPEYEKPYKDSRYLALWNQLASHLDKHIPVIDLGCGVGQCANLLHDLEFLMYLGVDFSPVAITKAQKLNLGEDYDFMCSEIVDFLQAETNLGAVQFLISETLEHLADDKKVLQLISEKHAGSKIVISVPSFDDPGHVRHFNTQEQVMDRYGEFIDIATCGKLGAWFYLSGVVK